MSRLWVKLALWSVAALAAAFLIDVYLDYLGWANTTGAVAEALLSLALITYLFFLARKNILAPLEKIEETAMRIMDGDLDARSEIASSREFKTLSDTLNSMVDRLAQSYNSLREYSLTLEKMVEERTQALAVEREKQISLLTHDLKSPLTSVIGYCDLLLSEDTLRDREREFISSVRDNGGRILDMVEQYLDLTKMGAGMLELDLRPTNVGRLVQDVVSDLAIQAHGKGVSLLARSQEGLADIEADRAKIARALTNLVQNAIKYTPEGGSVEVSARNTAGGGAGYVEVSVSDNGFGIPKEDLPRIFDSYFRAASSEGIRGSGLGLAVVKSMVEAHRGSVVVESEPGKGSVFRIKLPVIPAQAYKSEAGKIAG